MTERSTLPGGSRRRVDTSSDRAKAPGAVRKARARASMGGVATAPYHHGDLASALIAAGEAEIETRGLEGFSLRAVAKRAGVSHAAPAHHFGDARGLLTALTAEAFRRFLAMQVSRQQTAPADPLSQSIASGVAYVQFAVAHPAMFRLLFSSQRPDFSDPALKTASAAAFDRLEGDVRALTKAAGDQPEAFERDLTVVWALAHGLADLINGGRLPRLSGLRGKRRDAAVEAILRRGLAHLAVEGT